LKSLCGKAEDVEVGKKCNFAWERRGPEEKSECGGKFWGEGAVLIPNSILR